MRLSSDVERVQTTLRQIVRDWSADGGNERDSCYGVILTELLLLYPDIGNDSCDVSVLVPGSGLGRLAFDIAKLGFVCEGNEFSLHMLMASNFIINKCSEPNQYTVYPFTHSFVNNFTFEDQVRPIQFPDTSMLDLDDSLQFSMAAGNFLDIYNKPNNWNNIVTCFFIDTAHNVIEYIEKIWLILKPGGYWLNMGPLLYHFSNLSHEKSLELSYEQIKRIIEKIGFKYLKEDLNMKCDYINNSRSMMHYNYNCAFFVVQKPGE